MHQQGSNNICLIQKAEEYAKVIMKDEVAHDFKHVDRVRNWSLKIAQEQSFEDLEIVELSALLHDIGLSQAKKRKLHGEVGAELAATFLGGLLDQHRIDEIYNAIKFHNKNREGEGKLLMILRDADMMDLFGAVGIMRAFTSKSSEPEYDEYCIRGETWQMESSDFDDRFDKGIGIGKYIIDQINFQISCFDNLKTESAKKFAAPHIRYMQDFIEQLNMEIKWE